MLCRSQFEPAFALLSAVFLVGACNSSADSYSLCDQQQE